MSASDEEHMEGDVEEEEYEDVESNGEQPDGSDDLGDDVRDGSRHSFSENLPAKKDPVTKLSVVIPRHGSQTVSVLISPCVSFEQAYRRELKRQRHEKILKSLCGDHAATQQLLQQEEAQESDDGTDDEDGGDSRSEGQTKLPPPYWLPYLLADDGFHIERVLTTMYGWASPPLVSAVARSNYPTAGGPGARMQVCFSSNNEVDESPQSHDSVKANANCFTEHGAFTGDSASNSILCEGEEEYASLDMSVHTAKPEEHSQSELHTDSSASFPMNGGGKSGRAFPTPSILCTNRPFAVGMTAASLRVPAFPDANYVFYIAYDTNSEEWHLLDCHPLLFMFRRRQEQERRNRDGEERVDSVQEGEEVDEEDEDDTDDVEAQEKVLSCDDISEAHEYDLSTVVVVDAMMLAALYSPATLNCCLLQETAPSLSNLSKWMELDMDAGFPILQTIYCALEGLRSQSGCQLPYRISQLQMDFNVFFRDEYVLSRTRHLLHPAQREVSDDSMSQFPIEDVASLHSAAAIVTMQSLLLVGITPIGPLRLDLLDTVESIQLALWFLLVVPKSLLMNWAEMESLPSPAATDSSQDNGLDEEDEEEGSITESLVHKRIRVLSRTHGGASSTANGPFLIPTPFLLHLLLEIRRRTAREQAGKQPSPHSLATCLEPYYLPHTLEDGKPKGDALVTKHLYLGREASANTRFPGNSPAREQTESVETLAEGSTPDHSEHDGQHFQEGEDLSHRRASKRYQKLYQSDLALLLLALTSTPLVPPAGPQEVGDESVLLASPSVPASCVQEKMGPFDLPIDAHSELFLSLLRAKMCRLLNPLASIRSGTWRMLYLVLPRFRQLSTVQRLCHETPLYHLFGANERCPLPELVLAWATERLSVRHRCLDIFTNTFWHELYYRFLFHHYDTETMDWMTRALPDLMNQVNERHRLFTNLLSTLGACGLPRQNVGCNQHLSSATMNAFVRGPCSSLASGSIVGMEGVPSSCRKAAASLHTELQDTVTVMNPCPYSREFEEEEERVVAEFAALPMSPRSYFIPEALYALLFTQPRLNLVAIRYLMVINKISTVREHPFCGAEIPVIEAVLRAADATVLKLIVGLGVPLNEAVCGGSLTVEGWAERVLEPADVSCVREVSGRNRTWTQRDPGMQYGVLRYVRSAQ